MVLLLSDGMTSWLKKIKTRTKTEVSVTAAGIEVKFTRHKGKNHIDNLNHLVQGVGDSLPSKILLQGIQSPILIIDEASRLRMLLRDRDGQAALESLVEWLIMRTKKKHQFHVVLASSDSFFNLWVERFIRPSRYVTYLLGHLEEVEAERYWNVLLKQSETLLKRIVHPNFKQAFSVCGGSIFILNAFLKEWCKERGTGLIGNNVEKFSMVLQKQCRMMMAFRSIEEIEPPKWTKPILLDVMELITSDELLDFDTLCGKFGKEVVNSKIKYNLMHLRPRCTLS